MTGGSSLTVTGGSYSLAGLTNVNGSSLYAESGGSLTLPNLTSYTETDNTTFEATGTGSTLNLSALTTLGTHVRLLACRGLGRRHAEPVGTDHDQ